MRQIRLEAMQMRHENVLKNNVLKYIQLMSGLDLEICVDRVELSCRFSKSKTYIHITYLE